MKILLLIDSLGAGGAQRQLVGLATMLKRLKYNVIVVTYYDNSFYADILLNAGVPYVFLKDAHGIYKRITVIAKYIRKQSPDWVISYLETPSVVASIAHIFNRKFKLMVSERNTTQKVGKNEKIRFNLFRSADYVVANAYSQKKFIIKYFPYLEFKTFAIPNFVDTDLFVPVPRERRVVPEIVIAASIWKPKNTLGFIDAMKQLRDRGLKFHVSWYGKVPSNMEYFDECVNKIVNFGLQDCIRLLDKTKAIKEKYQNADYFILPSFYEGTPNVICEAMACGLPIACSNVCDNSIYVEPGKNGVLFNPHSVESMAEAIAGLLSIDSATYSSYCNHSREMAVEKLSKNKFVESYINLLENENLKTF